MGLKTCILGLSLILVMRWASAGMTFLSRFFYKISLASKCFTARKRKEYLLYFRDEFFMILIIVSHGFSGTSLLHGPQFHWTELTICGCPSQLGYGSPLWQQILHSLRFSSWSIWHTALMGTQWFYCIKIIRTLPTHFIPPLALITWIWSSKRGPNSISSFTHWPN